MWETEECPKGCAYDPVYKGHCLTCCPMCTPIPYVLVEKA